MKPFTALFVLLLGSFTLVMPGACSENSSSSVSSLPTTGIQIDTVSVKKTSIKDTSALMKSTLKVDKDTVLRIPDRKNFVNISIKVPHDEPVGVILLLHGWNLPASDWCIKMKFCQKAFSNGYILIVPEFGKSTYQWENYPETLKSLRNYPTRRWMYDTMLVALQDIGLLMKGQNNFVCGISTGARGAAFFALELPEIFKGCAALSGDFDQTKLQPGEWINTSFYGSLEEFKDRWTGKDNIYNRAKEYAVPTYFGHGTLDKTCPSFHSTDFYNQLMKLTPEAGHVLNNPEAGHDYKYWDSETEPILKFFRNLQSD